MRIFYAWRLEQMLAGTNPFVCFYDRWWSVDPRVKDLKIIYCIAFLLAFQMHVLRVWLRKHRWCLLQSDYMLLRTLISYPFCCHFLLPSSRSVGEEIIAFGRSSWSFGYPTGHVLSLLNNGFCREPVKIACKYTGVLSWTRNDWFSKYIYLTNSIWQWQSYAD